jgi:uncharacterized protein involved in outer membrane biogenesis
LARKPSPRDEPLRPARRWRRRLLYGASAFLLLLIVLLVAAPSLALNGWVEGRVASVLERRIGRPVVIEGVRIGWWTTFRIGRIELPGIEGEEGRPAVSLADVRSTFSLGRLFRGLPIRFGELEVGTVEANLIRLPDGQWNFDAIAKQLQSGATEEEVPEEEPPELPPGEASPSFPIDFSRIEIRSIHLRVIDAEAGVDLACEDGTFALLWAGGTAPLAMHFDGELRAGEKRMPWDVRAALEDWIDADRRLRLDAARIEARGGAGEAEGERRSAGQFRLDASLEAERAAELTRSCRSLPGWPGPGAFRPPATCRRSTGRWS